jgi:predicted DNA-binding transcriptional regulator YafY
LQKFSAEQRSNKTSSEAITMQQQVAELIGIGNANSTTIKSICDVLAPNYQRAEIRGDSFNKEITRICRRISKNVNDIEIETGLFVVSSRGKPTVCFWSDEETKTDFLSNFVMTETRALALVLVDEHIRDVLPSQYTDKLQKDIDTAYQLLAQDDNRLLDLIDFSPYGFQLSACPKIESNDFKEKTNTILNALLNKKPLKFTYRSIHPEYNQPFLIASPLKLQLLNHRLQMLAHVHKEHGVKRFDIGRITNLEIEHGHDYISADLAALEQKHVFVARCHTWVKDYFISVRFGGQAQFKQIADDVWEFTDHVTFPVHFKYNKPDSFYIANFLSMFADSIEVLEPAFLRNEMVRRSESLNKIYSGTDEQHNIGLITESPHNIANLGS